MPSDNAENGCGLLSQILGLLLGPLRLAGTNQCHRTNQQEESAGMLVPLQAQGLSFLKPQAQQVVMVNSVLLAQWGLLVPLPVLLTHS
jgi:hypothetical protein